MKHLRSLASFLLLACACGVTADLAPQVRSSIVAEARAEAQLVKVELEKKIDQKAGGDINDTLTVRLLVIGGIATSVFLSIVVYVVIVRPLLIKKELRNAQGK